jgi:hypothetical protein
LAGEGSGMPRHLGSAGDWNEWLEVTAAAGEGEEETHDNILSFFPSAVVSTNSFPMDQG